MKHQIIHLADLYGAHEEISHWGVSMRVRRKGDFIKRLRDGADCRTATHSIVTQWFSDHWPADLDWPADIVRPEPTPGSPAALAEDAA